MNVTNDIQQIRFNQIYKQVAFEIACVAPCHDRTQAFVFKDFIYELIVLIPTIIVAEVYDHNFTWAFFLLVMGLTFVP